MVWSGVAGPTCETRDASTDDTNSATSGESSKPTRTRRLRLSTPRSRGATASAVWRRAPGDRAVPLEEEGLRLRTVGDRVGHVARDAEPGSTIRERDDVLAVHALDHLVRAGVV